LVRTIWSEQEEALRFRQVRFVGLAIALLLTMASLPANAELPPGGTFSDDNGSVHEPNIEAIAAAQITAGCDLTGSLFCPNGAVTRAEMATFLIRALGSASASPYQGLFSDVPDGQWYTANVERLYELGITTGYSDGTFKPNGLVSRAEMAVFILRAIGQGGSLPIPQGLFVDVPIGEWFAPWVEQMLQIGITQGCAASPPTYCPHAAVTRAEMATFLTRAFGLTPIVPPPPPPPPPPVLPGEFAPFILSGSGDSVPSLTIPGDIRAILDFSYSSASNFIVVAYGAGNESLELLVNEIGAYSGRRPVNFNSSDGRLRYLEIKASGPWTIQVLPPSHAHTEWGGFRDDVVKIAASSSNRPISFVHTGSSNFIVWSYSNTRRLDLEVNEIGPYNGTALLDAGASFLEIQPTARGASILDSCCS
jgi:hypothetical protein